MSATCDKLSPILSREDDDYSNYLSKLYPLYNQNIAEGGLTFKGKPINVFRELNFDLRHQTFEHLTTKGNQDRLYNDKRCERLLWIRDILTDLCYKCKDIRIFEETKSNKQNYKRHVIWCTREDYAIILEERKDKMMLITAYCVLYNNKRLELNNKYKQFIKNKNANHKS